MPDQAYFEDDFWQARTITEPGESPASAPEKWARIYILAKWRFALARLTYAHLLSVDGQTDKSLAERSVAYARERVGLEDLIRAEAMAEERSTCPEMRRGLEFTHGAGAGYQGFIKAGIILDDAYRLMAWDAAQLDDRDITDAREAFSHALQEVWEAWWWRETMQCAPVQLATTLDETASYTAGQTAFDPAQDKYFTALRDCLGSDSDSFEEYVPRKGALSAYNAGTAYEAGDQFRYGGADYQCWTDAVAGTAPSDTDFFVPLQNWIPKVPWISYGGIPQEPFGPVRSVSRHDPRVRCNPWHYQLDVGTGGTQIKDLDVPTPWIWARRVTPLIFTGTTPNDWDATIFYDATPEGKLTWTALGNNYLVVEGAYLIVTV